MLAPAAMLFYAAYFSSYLLFSLCRAAALLCYLLTPNTNNGLITQRSGYAFVEHDDFVTLPVC